MMLLCFNHYTDRSSPLPLCTPSFTKSYCLHSQEACRSQHDTNGYVNCPTISREVALAQWGHGSLACQKTALLAPDAGTAHSSTQSRDVSWSAGSDSLVEKEYAALDPLQAYMTCMTTLQQPCIQGSCQALTVGGPQAEIGRR